MKLKTKQTIKIDWNIPVMPFSMEFESISSLIAHIAGDPTETFPCVVSLWPQGLGNVEDMAK